MNLWLRLINVLLLQLFRPPIAIPGGYSALDFRVWPHDLDLSLHMNNGRYLTIMDLGRLDMMVRSGLWPAARHHGWTPIASAVKIRFRREMRLLDRFRLETRLVAWDETAVVMEQIFLFRGGERSGQIAAHALFKGGLYDRAAKKFVPIAQLMAEVGATGDSPAMPSEVEAFLKADEELKRAGAERG